MKKVEEFQETQKLMEEFKGFDNKVSELENQIKQNENRANIKIERLESQLDLTWEDVEFEIDRKSLQEEIEKQIKNVKSDLDKENKELNKEIKESKDSKKYFRTDAHFQTITMEIEEMKKEVRKEELDLKKKDIELQEFYNEEEHENPLKWQEIYKEQDDLRKNIAELNAKIEEYSKFKEELNSINLTPEEYKKMFEREAERIAEEVKEAKAEEKKTEEKKPEEKKPEEKKSEEKKPEEKKTEEKKPEKTEKTEQEKDNPKEEDLAWEEYEKNNGYEENKKKIEQEETDKSWKEFEKDYNKNIYSSKERVSRIAISAFTNNAVVDYGKRNYSQIADLKYGDDLLNDEKYIKVMDSLEYKFDERTIKKMDPTIVNIIKNDKEMLTEYARAIEDNTEMPFELVYDLKDMGQADMLFDEEKKKMSKVARAASLSDNVEVSKDGIFTRIKDKFKSFFNKNERKALVEMNKSDAIFDKYDEIAEKYDADQRTEQMARGREKREKYEKYMTEKYGENWKDTQHTSLGYKQGVRKIDEIVKGTPEKDEIGEEDVIVNSNNSQRSKFKDSLKFKVEPLTKKVRNIKNKAKTLTPTKIVKGAKNYIKEKFNKNKDQEENFDR